MKGVTYGHGSLARRTALVCLAAVAIVGTMATSSAAAPGNTTMVSDDNSGLPSTGDSLSAAVSANGRYVAFVSDADNLVPQDNNELADIFVRDRQTGSLERVSVNSSELQARNGLEGSLAPSISSDGRYVAFASDALNLVQPDPNQDEFDVFVRDRVAGTTERVNVSSSETPGLNGGSGEPSISPDGRYVAFESFADNLIGGDTNGKSDVFLRDRTAGTTQRVSTTGSGGQALNGDSLFPSVSPDGRYVAFQSDATNLALPDPNGKSDIFVRDRTANTTQMVSVSSTGAKGDAESLHPSISSDGRYVAFESAASNLAAGDLNGKSDVFVRDRTANTTQMASVSSNEVEGDGESILPSISGDGRSVAFQSDAGNLAVGDPNGKGDVFVRDRTAGTTKIASVRSNGVKGLEESGAPAISSGGNFVAFESKSDNLVAGDLNGKVDVFIHELAGGGPGPDTTAPKVNTVTPAENAPEAPASSNVTATFSEAMQPASITTTTFKLAKLGTTPPAPVAAAVTYDAATKTATLDPSADLAAGTYRATVAIGAKDAAGNQLDQNATQTGNQPKTWTFTVTDAPPPVDTTPPTVASVSPTENATAVPAATNMTATFSEAMDPASIGSTSVRLALRNADGTTTPVAGAAVSYDAATNTATLDPASDLAPGTYQATITIGAKDAAGNQLDQSATTSGNQPKTWRFTVS